VDIESLNGEGWEGYEIAELELTYCLVTKLARGFGLAPRMVELFEVTELVELSLFRSGLDTSLETCNSLLAFLFVRPSQFKRIL